MALRPGNRREGHAGRFLPFASQPGTRHAPAYCRRWAVSVPYASTGRVRSGRGRSVGWPRGCGRCLLGRRAADAGDAWPCASSHRELPGMSPNGQFAAVTGSGLSQPADSGSSATYRRGRLVALPTVAIRGRCGNGHVLMLHGSMRSTPVSSKSRVLRVATAMRRERAMAAIWPSNWARGWPDRGRAATIAAWERSA